MLPISRRKATAVSCCSYSSFSWILHRSIVNCRILLVCVVFLGLPCLCLLVTSPSSYLSNIYGKSGNIYWKSDNISDFVMKHFSKNNNRYKTYLLIHFSIARGVIPRVRDIAPLQESVISNIPMISPLLATRLDSPSFCFSKIIHI